MTNWLTTAEVASQLRVAPNTVARWVRQNKIPKELVCRPSGAGKGSKVLISSLALVCLQGNVYNSNLTPMAVPKINSDGYATSFLKRF